MQSRTFFGKWEFDSGADYPCGAWPWPNASGGEGDQDHWEEECEIKCQEVGIYITVFIFSNKGIQFKHVFLSNL